MKTNSDQHLSKRVLKTNVGFLLADGPGNSQDARMDIPESIRVADDLVINYLKGPIRFTRAKEGILVQAQLHIGLTLECARCLDETQPDIEVEIEELYMHPTPAGTEFGVGADGVLDLAPVLRAEVLIEASHRVLCQAGCKGLCPECGGNRNHVACQCADNAIDPRLAKLKELLDTTSE